MTHADLLDRARSSLRSVAGLDLHLCPIALQFADGTMTLEGEVETVAAKKRALERIAALPGVTGIVDRLHVRPAQAMGDREIRDHLRDALLQEPAFAELAILRDERRALHSERDPGEAARGEIRFHVEKGIVTLSGAVPGLAYKRLAGVLAWWVPGSRDVVNGLAVEPPEEDSGEEVSDAVRLALEKDPFVDAGQIRVSTRGWVVTLDGLVPTQPEREMAEADAWYVFGVDEVVNRIEVRR